MRPIASLRQLQSIRRSVSNDTMQSLIVALVFSRLDYGSATLAGLLKQLMDRTLLHGWSSDLVVRTTFSRYYADYTGFGYQNMFHSDWQCSCIAVSTALHLATWPQIFSASHTLMHVDDCALRLHQHWLLHALCVLPLATAPFQRLLHRSGIICRSQSGHRHRCKFSATD